jgi:phenylpropionate dioxygenase-like ring-hydroxylating dioxygenase large terminal subunit
MTTTQLPKQVSTESIPWSWYSDPAVAAVEERQLFASSWQYFSSCEQLTEPGDFVTGQHGKVPLVVVRDEGGTLRGFLNVCRHRGTKICSGAGNQRTLQCPYHAWTYQLDGSLRSAPRSNREACFDASSLGLRPVQVDTWGPFVFVNTDLEAPSLADALGSLPDLVAEVGIDVSGLRLYQRWPHETAANWKIIIENYLECYHCQINHPGFSSVMEVGPDRYELSAAGPVLSHRTPLKERRRSTPYDVEGEITVGSYYVVLPSMTVDISPGRPNLSISNSFPDGPLRTCGITDTYFNEGVDPAWAEDLIAFDHQVGKEDQALVEAAQIGLCNGILDRGRLLAESEELLLAFEKFVFERCEPFLASSRT